MFIVTGAMNIFINIDHEEEMQLPMNHCEVPQYSCIHVPHGIKHTWMR